MSDDFHFDPIGDRARMAQAHDLEAQATQRDIENKYRPESLMAKITFDQAQSRVEDLKGQADTMNILHQTHAELGSKDAAANKMFLDAVGPAQIRSAQTGTPLSDDPEYQRDYKTMVAFKRSNATPDEGAPALVKGIYGQYNKHLDAYPTAAGDDTHQMIMQEQGGIYNRMDQQQQEKIALDKAKEQAGIEHSNAQARYFDAIGKSKAGYMDADGIYHFPVAVDVANIKGPGRSSKTDPADTPAMRAVVVKNMTMAALLAGKPAPTEDDIDRQIATIKNNRQSSPSADKSAGQKTIASVLPAARLKYPGKSDAELSLALGKAGYK